MAEKKQRRIKEVEILGISNADPEIPSYQRRNAVLETLAARVNAPGGLTDYAIREGNTIVIMRAAARHGAAITVGLLPADMPEHAPVELLHEPAGRFVDYPSGGFPAYVGLASWLARNGMEEAATSLLADRETRQDLESTIARANLQSRVEETVKRHLARLSVAGLVASTSLRDAVAEVSTRAVSDLQEVAGDTVRGRKILNGIVKVSIA